MARPDRPLDGAVAVVAGATRGAGRGIAVELGAAGATVYVTGRSTRDHRSEMQRPEVIEETAELVDAAGGRGIALCVDHTAPEQVAALFDFVSADTGGSLDVLVNNVWGGDPLTQWDVPFWEHDLDSGLRIQQLGVASHMITSHYGARLLIAAGSGLIVEVTDGADERYRGNLYYDLAKSAVARLAVAQAEELRNHKVAAVAVTPGFLRSEAVLDHFGVTEAAWRAAIQTDPHFAASESPRYIGRAVAALAADPGVMARTGQLLSSWELADQYNILDVDGSRPDWGAHFRTHILGEVSA